GDRAMTGAERQARCMERKMRKSVTDENLIAECEKLKARIAELEKALRAAKQRESALQQQKEQEWRRPSAAESREIRLKAKIRELEALVLPLDDEGKTAVGQHKRKLNRHYKALWKQSETLLKQHHITMSAKDYTLFIAGFHPEASKEKRDQARNRFVDLYKKH